MDPDHMKGTPLLTIAIPTWNRATYLEQNLKQLRSEMSGIDTGKVEILVSDNCSSDNTPSVVKDASLSGLPITYIRNEDNIGWGPNFVQCFKLAKGKYVLLLGDDDLIIDGALEILLNRLAGKAFGVVCLRTYGFDWDFRDEYPGSFGNERVFNDSDEFLLAIGLSITMISACVVNKDLVHGADNPEFVSNNLAQLHFVVRAILAAEENLFINKYLVAIKRNNWADYGFADVYVKEMWGILDGYVRMGLNPNVVRGLESRYLLSYYPWCLLDMRMRLNLSDDLEITLRDFESRFQNRWLFRYWLAPILWLPKPLGIIWGGLATFIGRVAAGDLRRGIAFAWYRLLKKVHWRK